MKSFFTGSWVMVLALVAITGCNRGSSGGPGATDSNTKQPIIGQVDDTFNLSVPSSLPLRSTTLKQGETTQVVVGINRGKKFDQDVMVKFADLPSGVSVDPASFSIEHGVTEAKFTLKATDEAALGDFTVQVTGHPTEGNDAKNDFKITVAKKSTFTLSVPSSLYFVSTAVKQGKTTKVAIGINRDKHFDQDVTLKFAGLPKGVTLDPVSSVIKHGDTGANLMLVAADDAVLGEFTLSVTGHPTKGHDATNDFKVTVYKQ
jgi:uncharacterized membrane protein